MSDPTLTTTVLESPPMGTFDENGEYNPRRITENDLGSLTLEEAYAATLVDVQNGQLVEGTVVRIDRDEVLVDIGYKSEGVIPQKELSIRNNADPGDVVALGEQIEHWSCSGRTQRAVWFSPRNGPSMRGRGTGSRRSRRPREWSPGQ